MVQGRHRVSNHAMAASPNCSRSPVSSAAVASPPASDWIDALTDQVLNTTIFGINRMSIRDSRPKNILKCLEADRRDPSRSAQLYRQLYLSDGLAKADHMYTTDVKGHHGCVNTLALSNQGEEFLVSAGDDQRVLVWRVADMIQAGSRTPRPIIMTSQHSANVFTADFSCDNQYIYSGGDDSELIKHDFNTGQPISHHEHLDAVYSVAPHPSSPSIVLTASEDGCVYTIDTRQPLRRVDSGMMLCESSEAYHCAVFNPVEPSLVAVCNSYNGTALYDTRQRKRLVRYKCTTWPIVREDAVSACFDRMGQQLYVMHRVLPPVLYDLWHEEARLSFMDNTGSYRNVVTMKSGCFMGQNDEYVVSGSDDFRVYIWKIPNTRRGTQLFLGEGVLTMNMSTMPHLILPGHRSIVNQTCYSRVHHVLASSGVEKIIKIWSHERLNSSQKVSHSRAPPSRSRYSIRERDELINETPADPLSEDTSVLALFDSLIEEGEDTSDFLLTSSDDDDDDNDSGDLYLMEGERRLRRVIRAFPPLFGHGFQLFSDDNDSDATPTDSELSCANTSSLDPLWSTDEDDIDFWSDHANMEGLDEELLEMYGSDVADWGSSDSSEPSMEEEEEGGRIIRISNHHGGVEARGRDKDNAKETGSGSAAGVKKERTRKTVGPSGSHTSSEPACGSASRSELQPQPTRRCQPSRKAKKTTAASASKENAKKIPAAGASASKENTSSAMAEKKGRESSSAAGGSSQRRPKKDEGSSKSGNSKKCQPKRKVKSSPSCPSAATGRDSNIVEAINSGPLASSSSSSMAKPKKSGSGSRAVANGNGSDSTGSGRGSRAVADGNGETTGGGSSSGPSQRWTRKRNRRQQEANGTAADNYEQYRAEDFLKAKSPKSFYAKKKDPP